MNWYVGKTGTHPGLVINEATGANVAVVYDDKHTALVAAAPLMLEALIKAQAVIGDIARYGNASDDETEAYEQIKRAIQEAEQP